MRVTVAFTMPTSTKSTTVNLAMSNPKPESKRTCQRCGTVWYVRHGDLAMGAEYSSFVLKWSRLDDILGSQATGASLTDRRSYQEQRMERGRKLNTCSGCGSGYFDSEWVGGAAGLYELPGWQGYWDGGQWAGGPAEPSVEAPAEAPAPVWPAAGWFADPWAASRLRYWDGEAWTAHLAQ